LKAGAKGATEKVVAKAQLATLEKRTKDQRAKAQAVDVKAKAWLE
jgi:hypothetical protein